MELEKMRCEIPANRLNIAQRTKASLSGKNKVGSQATLFLKRNMISATYSFITSLRLLNRVWE
jgi:hypothetical protein